MYWELFVQSRVFGLTLEDKTQCPNSFGLLVTQQEYNSEEGNT